jgi:hypothetical protein
VARSITLTFLITAIAFLFAAGTSDAQTRSYELIPAPDIWYNDVDGIRLGLRLKGQVPGTFEDGPHRLDFGVWLGAWLPDLPVSYYLSYTEPIPAWSDYGSEASIQAISSIRTGYHRHGVAFNKRWQQGFDERRYREMSFFNSYERRFDDEYAAFPLIWSDDHHILSKLTAEYQDDNRLGWYNLSATGTLQYLDDGFGTVSLSAIQRIPFGEYWGLRLRAFAGLASSGTAPEYLFSRSGAPAVHTIDSGITRAKGTIPQPWMRSGNFHIAGGPNLRGYTSRDVPTYLAEPCENCLPSDFVVTEPVLFRSMGAINAEFDYFNPVQLLFKRIPYVADFIDFRSYLFFDAGQSLGAGDDPDPLFADAGAGFSLSLNIPDYLGKPRGFVLRYEMPFWLSEPGNEDSFKFRHLFGFGAVISF